MARNLKENTSLRKMKMQEHPEYRWSEKSKNEFIKLLRTQKVPLNKVKFEDAEEILAARVRKEKKRQERLERAAREAEEAATREQEQKDAPAEAEKKDEPPVEEKPSAEEEEQEQEAAEEPAAAQEEEAGELEEEFEILEGSVGEEEKDMHAEFREEILFYVKKIKLSKKAVNEMKDRLDSCAHEHMFKNLLSLIEDSDEHEKMPVRKFFNNTFGVLLNDAIFSLLRKQQKTKHQPGSAALFSTQGMVKFVAHYLQDNIPDNEDGAGSEEEADETDEV